MPCRVKKSCLSNKMEETYYYSIAKDLIYFEFDGDALANVKIGLFLPHAHSR